MQASMQITGIKTEKAIKKTDLLTLLDTVISALPEKSVLAVTSKIIAIAQGRTKPADFDKDELIQEEASLYLPREGNKYRVSLTITKGNLVATAGIDESNGNGMYVLWPGNPQKTANEIRNHFRQRFNLREFGIIITDSKTAPLRWGVTAFALAYSGFEPLRDYIGKKDLFGREFAFEKLNVADSLATAAAFVMGEGAEQTPLALIQDIPHITFVNHNPSDEELAQLSIDPADDLYGPLLQSVVWKKGKGKKVS